MKRLAIAVALGLASCGDGIPARDRVFIEKVQARLDSELLDYPSARFQHVRLTTTGGILCGQVNAKNRMGAYTGWSAFIAIDSMDETPPYLYVAESPDDALGGCNWSEEQWREVDLSERLSATR